MSPKEQTTETSAELAFEHPVAGQLRAVPLNAMSKAHDIAPTTMWELRKQGRGPRVFKIGKRIYVTPSAWAEWIELLDANGGPKGLADTAGARAAVECAAPGTARSQGRKPVV